MPPAALCMPGLEGSLAGGRLFLALRKPSAYGGGGGARAGVGGNWGLSQALSLITAPRDPRSTRTQNWRCRYWACPSAASIARRAAAGMAPFGTYR